MRFGPTKRARGATIGTVLLLSVIVVTLALALTGSSVTHLHLSHKATNGMVAHGMAESAIAAGLEKVLQNDEFGSLRTEADILTLTGGEDGAHGRLSFNEQIASDWGVAFSTNNLKFDGARSGAKGQVVPGSSIHLVGQGECNGVVRTVEAIFYVPQFPYVVASSGRFTTEGQTLIASVDEADALKTLTFDDLDELQPGDVIANSLAHDSLKIGEGTVITGDAKSAGGIEKEPGAQILGQLLTDSSPESIPHYSVNEFDPDATGKLGVSHLNDGVIQKANYEGWVRREGDLFITQGLHLDNGVLYVNGNLTVSGGVSGVGALFVTGNTVVTGKSSLSTDNMAAIVSEGDITLQGPKQQTSIFRGLVYSNKGLMAENMTLVGTLLLGGEENDLLLKDTRIVYSPDSVRVDLQHSARTGLVFVSPKGSNPGTFLGTREADKSVNNKRLIYVSNESDGTFVIYPQGVDEADGTRADTVEEAIAAIRDYLLSGLDGKELQAFENSVEKKLRPLLSELESGSREHEEDAVDLVTLDPTRFLSLADKIRLLLIRDV